jgi:hypothetical protein
MRRVQREDILVQYEYIHCGWAGGESSSLPRSDAPSQTRVLQGHNCYRTGLFSFGLVINLVSDYRQNPGPIPPQLHAPLCFRLFSSQLVVAGRTKVTRVPPPPSNLCFKSTSLHYLMRRPPSPSVFFCCFSTLPSLLNPSHASSQTHLAIHCPISPVSNATML